MVSKRLKYLSDSATDDDDDEILDNDWSPNSKNNNKELKAATRRPTRTPKCFSKNALMARENRLKKKLYVNTLESELAQLKENNRKMIKLVNGQSKEINLLKNEVKYLKSVLANSEGIGKLINAITTNTGMSVSSSLERNNLPIQKEIKLKKHPWEEETPDLDLEERQVPYSINLPATPESADSYYGSPEFEELDNEGLLLDMDIPLEMAENQLINMMVEKSAETPATAFKVETDDKIGNLQSLSKKKVDEDAGICLHVSNNKVSLEFCPFCTNNAQQQGGWKVH